MNAYRVYRIALIDRYIDLRMPSWLFFFFKRFCKVESSRHNREFNGQSLDVIVFDEADFT